MVTKLRRWIHNTRLALRRGPMEPVKLWLDDLRPPPGPDWHWAGTVDHAKDVLVSRYVAVASLDHDLGRGETGYDLVKWLCELDGSCGMNYWPSENVYVHSANPVGNFNMLQLIHRYSPYNRS